MINMELQKEDVDKLVANSIIKTKRVGNKSVVVTVILENGFEVTETQQSMTPEDFYLNSGKKYCLNRIGHKIAELEAYRLHCENHKKIWPPREREVEQIAFVAYQLNKVYCEFNDDDSQLDWYDAEEWVCESIRNGVKFRLDNAEVSASLSHENWLAHKQATGWKYGKIKDIEKKEHPCMVPFDELPVSQQFKDVLFKAVVDAMRRMKVW